MRDCRRRYGSADALAAVGRAETATRPRGELIRSPSGVRIEDALEFVEFDAGELAADTLGAPDIDGLDDVALLRADLDRPARTLDRQPFQGLDQRIAIGPAAAPGKARIEHGETVIGGHRHVV